MVDAEREVEMELEGDSNEVSGSPTTRSIEMMPSQFGMDYEMELRFSSLSPPDPWLYSFSMRNSPSPGRLPQSPEFEIALWDLPSPRYSRLISFDGNVSSSTQPLVRSPSPLSRKQGLRLQRAVNLLNLLRWWQRAVRERIFKQAFIYWLEENWLYMCRKLFMYGRIEYRLEKNLLRNEALRMLQAVREAVNQLEKNWLRREALRMLRAVREAVKDLLSFMYWVQANQAKNWRQAVRELSFIYWVQANQLKNWLQAVTNASLRQQLKELLFGQQLEELLLLLVEFDRLQNEMYKFNASLRQQLEELLLVQELDRLQNENRELHKFIQHASQITLQMKIKCAPRIDNMAPEVVNLRSSELITEASCNHNICEEGHDNASIQILDKMNLVTDLLKLHFSWTKAPCRHRSLANGGDLKKSCTSLVGCYMHQDCTSTAKLEIYAENDIAVWFQGAFSSHIPFFCSEDPLLHYACKIELQRFHAICEPITSADDQPDSRCELTLISDSTKSPRGPNGLPDGEEMLQQDSLKHQLVGETHAINDGEKVFSEGGIHSAVSYPENEGTRKTPMRKITLEDLQHFSGSRTDAVKHFGVSESTIKRCLRDHNIRDWRNRKIDKNNQCLFEPKDIIESFQGEGAEMGNQMAGGSISCKRELNHEQIASDRSQIGVGLMEESSSRLETTPTGNMFASSAHEQCIEEGDHSELPVRPSELNLSAANLRPDVVKSTLPPVPKGELLMENSGSPKELSDHYISATEEFNAKQVPDSSRTILSCSDLAPKLANATAAHMMPLVTETQDTRTVTMKATYRGEMIRFQLPLTSGIIELRNEVAERLMLDVGTFSIRYIDDDEDWISMTCDKDLQECFNISVSLSHKVIKLSICDITPS